MLDKCTLLMEIIWFNNIYIITNILYTNVLIVLKAF